MTPGHVAIVGAGPGDPELLTTRARRRLKRADLVLHDGLVPATLLDLAPRAVRRPITRRRGQTGPSPAAVAAMIARAARRGLRVVRLRSGDPYLLARGAEEAQALTAAGIPFEVVPGITSAMAAPLAAGIPLTHRGASSAVVIVSGHASRAFGPVLDSLTPDSATVVVLMGLTTRAHIARRLMRAGWRGDTAAAIVWDGTRPTQAVWRGPLATLGTAPVADTRAAGVVIVGAVAALTPPPVPPGDFT